MDALAWNVGLDKKPSVADKKEKKKTKKNKKKTIEKEASTWSPTLRIPELGEWAARFVSFLFCFLAVDFVPARPTWNARRGLSGRGRGASTFFFSLGFSSFFLPPPRFDVFAFLLLLLLLLLYLLLFLVPLSQHHVV